MTHAKHILTGFVLLAAATLPAGPAQAASQTVRVGKTSAKTVRAGAKASTTVAVSGRPSTCRITAGKQGRTVKMRDAQGVRFAYRISTRARPGRYTIRLTCATAHTRYTVTVRPPRRGRPGTGRTLITGKVTAQFIGEPSPSVPQAGTPTTGPTSDPAYTPGKTYTADSPEVAAFYRARVLPYHSTWRNGECTDLADQRRPDIYERVTKVQIAAWMSAGGQGPLPYTRWTAYLWPENAKIGGFDVDQTPSVNSIVAWPQVDGYGSGHVAYILSVAETTFRVQEMNFNGHKGIATERTVAISDIRTEGLQIIH